MINEVTIQGRLMGTPTLRLDRAGIRRTMFSVACERDEVADGSKKDVDYIDCVAWGRKAQRICSEFHQGEEVILTGRIQTSRTLEGGIQTKRVEVKIETISLYSEEESEDTF